MHTRSDRRRVHWFNTYSHTRIHTQHLFNTYSRASADTHVYAPVSAYLQSTHMHTYASVAQSCPALCDPVDCNPARLLYPWDSPGRNTGVGRPALLQGGLPDPGIEPASPTLAGGFFTVRAAWQAPDIGVCASES